MSGGSDKITMGDRAGMNPGSHESGYVGHIHHEVGTYVFTDLLKKTEVNAPGIGACACNNQFWTMFSRQTFNLLQVNSFALFVHPIGNYVVQPAGEIDWTAVGEMAPMPQVHSHNGFSRL